MKKAEFPLEVIDDVCYNVRMLYRWQSQTILTLLSASLCSCQLINQGGEALESLIGQEAPKEKEDAAKDDTEQTTASNGAVNAATGASQTTVEGAPQTAATGTSTTVTGAPSHQPSAPSASTTPAGVVVTAARGASRARSTAPQIGGVRHQSAADGYSPSVEPYAAIDTVRVSHRADENPWLGGVVPVASPQLPAEDSNFLGLAPEATQFSAMRHPRTPSLNTPVEEEGSTTREPAPRPNKAELRGLRAPQLKSKLPLPHKQD